MNKKITLFFVIIWGLTPALNGQESGTFLRFQNQFSVALVVHIPNWLNVLNQPKNKTQFSAITLPPQWQSVAVPSPDRSPRIYNYHEIGIFCKLDVKLDKASKLPIRFRLGTQEIVDRKEGKY